MDVDASSSIAGMAVTASPLSSTAWEAISSPVESSSKTSSRHAKTTASRSDRPTSAHAALSIYLSVYFALSICPSICLSTSLPLFLFCLHKRHSVTSSKAKEFDRTSLQKQEVWETVSLSGSFACFSAKRKKLDRRILLGFVLLYWYSYDVFTDA